MSDHKKILVTGSAGFIGHHTTLRLAAEGHEVMGIDNLNTYYSIDLKLARLRAQGIPTDRIEYHQIVEGKPGIRFMQLNITDGQKLEELFQRYQFDYVVHLAAQAGVRYSIENPHVYIDTNVKGFLEVLECCRRYHVKHLVFASSSSVYGTNDKVPFSEEDRTDQQVSLYAATKKANEAMAHSYASVYGLPVTGLRFFTVYGPFGRPDMALFKFTDKIIKGDPIDVYNHGNLSRDFTYIDDIVDGLMGVIPQIPHKDPPYSIYNIGRGEPVSLHDFIQSIEQAAEMKAIRHNLPMQPGDVEKTWADTSNLHNLNGYKPKTRMDEGVKCFVEWYKNYLGIH